MAPRHMLAPGRTCMEACLQVRIRCCCGLFLGVSRQKSERLSFA